jgi:hypothetical protein
MSTKLLNERYDFMAPKVEVITGKWMNIMKPLKWTRDNKFIAAKKPKRFTDVKISTTKVSED